MNGYAKYSGIGGGSGGVTSLNSLTGALTLVPGTGITITPSGSNITIAATNAGTVTDVTASSPLFSSGGSTPNLTIQNADATHTGALTLTDWNTFNNKQDGPLTGDVTTSAAIATLKAIPNKVYVDFISGNDSNTGTIVQPWKTLQHAYNSISPTINTPYVIYLSGGNNDTDVGTITGKPDTSIVADFPTRVNALTISGGITNSNGCTFINLIFTGAVTWTRNDSTTIGLTLINTEFFSGPTLKQTGSGVASITAVASVFVNSEFLIGNGGFGVFSDCSFLGTTLFDDPITGGASYLQFDGGYSGGAMTITGFYNPCYFTGFVHDVAFGASLTFVTGTGGFAAVEVDSAGLPPTYTGTPSSLTLLSQAPYLNGNLRIVNFNSGTSASSSTFWRGDGTWAVPSGGGGADTALDNLTTTAINQDLIFGVPGVGTSNTLQTADDFSDNNNTGSLTIRTGNDTGATSVQNTGNLNLLTGSITDGNGNFTGGWLGSSGTAVNSSSGSTVLASGDSSGGGFASGNVVLQVGAGDTRGLLQLRNGSEGTAGQVWTSTDSNGSGQWALLSLTSGVTGVLPTANGGTEVSASGGAGNVLMSNGSVWQSKPLNASSAFVSYASSQVTTLSSSLTGGSFATFSNSPAFTFTPTITGTYKVYASVPLEQDTVNTIGVIRIFNTSGGATLLQESQAWIEVPGVGSDTGASSMAQSNYTLTAGVSYVFDIQGKASGGSLFIEGNNCPFYMFAEGVALSMPFTIFTSSQVTTDSSVITSGSFTTFSNSPAFTFSPSITGTYKVYSGIPLMANSTSGVQVGARVFNTSGGGTLLAESDSSGYNSGSGQTILQTAFTQSTYTLTAGTSYVFDIQGQVFGGTGSVQLGAASGKPFYMFAELCG